MDGQVHGQSQRSVVCNMCVCVCVCVCFCEYTNVWMGRFMVRTEIPKTMRGIFVLKVHKCKLFECCGVLSVCGIFDRVGPRHSPVGHFVAQVDLFLRGRYA